MEQQTEQASWLPIMSEEKNRRMRLSKIWFWTVEIFSFCVIATCWLEAFVPAAIPWSPKLVFPFLFQFSSMIVLLLFLTVCFCWRLYRRLAIGGLVTCLLWIVWAEVSRLNL